MSLVFNMVGGSSGGGSGPSASDAILTVTVPTGSTVTAVKGGVTLTPTMWVQAADATLDCALFVIAPAQFDATVPWTVTATLSTESATATVLIDSNKQYEAEITFKTWLFRNGAAESLTGGVELVAGASMAAGYIHTTQNTSTGNYWEFVNALDVLSYGMYLHYRFRATSIASGWAAYLGTFSSKLTASSYATNQAKRAAVNVIAVSSDFVDGYVDLGSLTLGTNYYVGFVGIATTDLESMWISKTT